VRRCRGWSWSSRSWGGMLEAKRAVSAGEAREEKGSARVVGGLAAGNGIEISGSEGSSEASANSSLLDALVDMVVWRVLAWGSHHPTRVRTSSASSKLTSCWEVVEV